MTEEYAEVRLSDLLRYCSVGAVVRTQKSVMVVNDIRRWISPGRNLEDQEIRHVDRVCKALGIANMKLCTPPYVTEQENNEVVHGWIPASRFPKWDTLPEVRIDALGTLEEESERRYMGL